MYDLAQHIIDKAKFLEMLPEELSILYDNYLFDGNEYYEEIMYFIEYCIKHTKDSLITPRGEEGWTYQQILDEDKKRIENQKLFG